MSFEEKQTVAIDEEVAGGEVVASKRPTYTPEDERRLVRKLDMRIMPMACIMYLFACAYFLCSSSCLTSSRAAFTLQTSTGLTSATHGCKDSLRMR